MSRSLVILMLLAGFCQAESLRADPAVITLHPAAATGEEIVFLQDVATIKGGSREMRSQLEQIDLWEFKGTGSEEATITRALIRTRLLLADFPDESFEIVGEEEAVVRHGPNIQTASAQRTSPLSARSRPRTSPRSPSPTPLSDVELERLLHEGIAESLQLDPEDVRVRLAQACLPRSLPKELVGKVGVMEPMLPTRPLPGRVTVGVRVLVDQKVVANVQTQVDLAIRRTLLVAAADLPRGAKLSDADLEEHAVWLTRAEPHPRRSDAIDATLNRDVFQGQPLKMSDLVRRGVGGSGDTSVVVKNRDKVQMTARKGGLVVVVRNAEAQQQGRVGDWISVRNTSSGKIVSARVVGPGEVEVPLF